MGEFDGKVILITGAGRGIGRALALAFSAQGACVAANDLTPINLNQTMGLVRQAGGSARDYIFDISKRMPAQELVSQVVNDWGRLDILVNNAAVHPHDALLEMDDWDWHRTLDVNLSGPFYLMQLAGQAMRQQGSGAIVNIAAADGGIGGLPESAALVASKMGLIGLTRAAARELAPYHIRVNAICPGVIDTERTAHAGQDLDQALARVPQGRLGVVEDVARLALFLCSSGAEYLTGQAINLAGGLDLGSAL